MTGLNQNSSCVLFQCQKMTACCVGNRCIPDADDFRMKKDITYRSYRPQILRLSRQHCMKRVSSLVFSHVDGHTVSSERKCD